MLLERAYTVHQVGLSSTVDFIVYNRLTFFLKVNSEYGFNPIDVKWDV
jgi:hypothetical protein